MDVINHNAASHSFGSPHVFDSDLFTLGGSQQTLELLNISKAADPDPFVFNESHHSARLVAGLRYLRDRSQLFDVTLLVEGREFSAHRVVLASCSDYFHAMFTNGLKESSQQCITLSAVTAAAMEQLIHFAYTSKLKITKENVVALLSGASHVQMLPAVAACERYLRDHVTMSNVMAMERLADLYSLAGLTRTVHAFICQKWVEFVTTSTFFELTSQQLLAVLRSDFPVFCSEVKVLEAVFAWINRNCSVDRASQNMNERAAVGAEKNVDVGHTRRSTQCEDLLRTIRWENLTDREVGQLLSTSLAERVTRAFPRVLAMVLRAFPSLAVLRETRTHSAQNVSIVNIAYSRHGKQQTVVSRDVHISSHNVETQSGYLNSNVATLSDASHANRHSPGAASVGQPQAFCSTIRINSHSGPVIHANTHSGAHGANIQGGAINRNSLELGATIHVRQAGSTVITHVNNSSTRTRSSTERNGASCGQILAPVPGVVNARGFLPHLLIVGGFHVIPDPEEISNDILCLRPGTETPVPYTTIPHLPQTDFGMTVMDNRLFVVGGCCNEDFSEVTHPYAFRFDPVTTAWTSLPPMMQERCRFYLGSLNGLLYAVGGEVDNSQVLASCETFDPQSGRWSPISPIPSSRSELAGCASGGKLYVSGGEDAQDMVEQVHSELWCYDPTADSWSLKASMPHARADHSMIAHANHIYVMGGWGLSDGDRVPVSGIDRYDVETDSWHTVLRMKSLRRSCSCTLLQGKVYVVGGGWEGGVAVKERREVDVLDLNSLQWQEQVVSVPTVWEHSAVAIHLPRKP